MNLPHIICVGMCVYVYICVWKPGVHKSSYLNFSQSYFLNFISLSTLSLCSEGLDLSTAYKNWFSSTLYAPGVEHRLSALAASTFIHSVWH